MFRSNNELSLSFDISWLLGFSIKGMGASLNKVENVPAFSVVWMGLIELNSEDL